MQRYFFDIIDGKDFPDLQGSEWPNLDAARVEAVRYAAEVLKEMPDRFWNCEIWTMLVYDQHRRLLFTLKFLAQDAPSNRLSAAEPYSQPAGAFTPMKARRTISEGVEVKTSQ